jgi:hypothetical protein
MTPPRPLSRATLAAFLTLLCTPLAAKERWIYLPANFQVDAEADRVITFLQRAKAAGYTHALLTDSKFARLGDVLDRYFTNARRVKDHAAELGIALIPAVFPIGYSNNLLYHNPNLAEGLPVKDALFVLHDGEARQQPDPPVALRDGAMNDHKAWTYVDDNIAAENGTMHSRPTATNARLAHKLKLAPFRQYHVSVRVRTRGFTGGMAEIKAIAAGNTQLQWTNTGVKPDQDWTLHHVTFNSLDHREVTLFFGVWGGHRGDLWWDDAVIEECGLVNLLRRPGTPLKVRTEDGQELLEGRQFSPVVDPRLGTKPWPGEYDAWHIAPALRVPGLPDGTRLRVSFYHPHIIYDGQVCACPSEPQTDQLLRDEARRIRDLWQAGSHLMSHDEWRVLGWDQACAARRLSPGQIVADNARRCVGFLREVAPKARVAVWSDMFDPHHNAVDRYYLVNGPLADSWTGLASSVLIVNWNSGHAKESLRFFADRGHPQLLAGYYDGKPESIRPWLAEAKQVKGVVGAMYTTWRQNYQDLESFARELESAGF